MKSNRFPLVSIVLSLSLALISGSAHASAFNPSRIIDDGVFDNSGTMSIAQINSWLNQFPSSCISTNNGFSAPDPTGYNPTQGFTYGANVSAGQVIHDAAAAYGINPQVILTTLQKEQSLVDGTAGCSTLRYAAATGYGCPDGGTTYNYTGVDLYTINATTYTSVTGTCVNSSLKVGFSQQVIRASWLLKFGEQRSEGNINWNVQLTNYPENGDSWNNADDPQSCYGGPMTQGAWETCPSGGSAYFDGYTTIDGSSTLISNGATAALYWYTPHFAGNQNFDNIFTSWFGGLYTTNYYAAPFSQSGAGALNPGQQAVYTLSYKNLGSQPWYDNTSLSTAPSGSYAVHLATDNPINRLSQFSATWPGAARPAVNFAAVYESDGTTLAANQHVVQPGQIAKFSFTVSVPQQTLAATYNEYFVPVLEGTSGSFNDEGSYLSVTVNAMPALTTFSQSTSPTVAPGTYAPAYLNMQNTGNTPLYDDTSIAQAPPGTDPVHLATTQPLNNLSDFSATWPGAARPAVNFAAVYESDGTTLAANQHVVQPGQIAKFAFDISVPAQYTAGTYNLHVQPILEGTSSGYFPDSGIYWSVIVPSTPVFSVTDNSQNITLSSGQPGRLDVTVLNLGNTTADTNTIVTTPDGAPFEASSWVSSSQIMSLPSSITPGSTVNLTIPITSPVEAATKSLSFTCNFTDNGSSIPLSKSGCSLNAEIVAYTYSAAYSGESNWPTVVPGQSASLYFEYKNTGNQPWYDDTSLATATWRNNGPVHLATDDPLNRPSSFDDSWPGAARPAVNFAAVYESDGTTLAANQHVVQPGQIAKFSYLVSPPTNLWPGTYREYFQPIVEGTSGLFGRTWTFQDITVPWPIYTDSFVGQSAYPLVARGSQASAYFLYKNTGNQLWYDDTSLPSAPSGSYAVHLATDNPINRLSQFSATWPGAARPAVNFAAVYESDGTTLAANQHVVQPGQIAKFSFTFTAPSSIATGTYRESFRPILEGTSSGVLNDPGTYLDVTVSP